MNITKYIITSQSLEFENFNKTYWLVATKIVSLTNSQMSINTCIPRSSSEVFVFPEQKYQLFTKEKEKNE